MVSERQEAAGESRGFALPTAIFGLVVLGVLVVGGFYMARQELRIGMSTENSALAFYGAEQGLSEVMANWSSNYSALAQWESDTVTGTVDDGTWEVEVTRTGDYLYFLRGTATVSRGGELYRGATRELGVLTRWESLFNLDPPAALTIRGGFTANGAPNKVNGADQNPPNWASVCTTTLEDKPGVLTDDASAISTSGGGGKGGGGGASCPSQISGTPCILEDATQVDEYMELIEDDDSWDALVALAEKSLTSLPNNKPSASTVNGACDTSDPYNWGDPDNPGSACGSYYPLIYINGNAQMKGNTAGQGILLVDGTFSMSGTPRFNGIILVRGTFNASSGTPDIAGAVMATQLGTLNGNPAMDYSSCAVQRSILMNSNFTRVRPITERGWVDLSGVGGTGGGG